jgi:hypothetical protein
MYVKTNCYEPNDIFGKVISVLRRLAISGAWAKKIFQRSVLFGKLGPVEIPDTVKRAIARLHKPTYVILTKGETSLSRTKICLGHSRITLSWKGIVKSTMYPSHPSHLLS